MALFETKSKSAKTAAEADSFGCCAPSGSVASCGSAKESPVKSASKAK